MKKRKGTKILIGVACSILLMFSIFLTGRIEYNKNIKKISFEGAIFSYVKERNGTRTPIILNPNNFTDYVKISFDRILSQYNVDRIYELRLDKDGIYLLAETEAIKKDELRILFLSFDGFEYITAPIPCEKYRAVYSSLLTNEHSIIFNVCENIYQLEKFTWKMTCIGQVRDYHHGIYPYLEGVIGQNGRYVEYIKKNHREIVCHLPEGMHLNGWFEEGKSILAYKNKSTYILNIKNSEVQKFHGYPLDNLGVYNNTALIYLLPDVDGGKSIFDRELSSALFLGNEVFIIYRMGLYDKKTGYIVNLPNSLQGGGSSLLPMDYDRKKFEKIKMILENPEHNISAE